MSPSNRLPTGKLPFQPPSNQGANRFPTAFQGGVFQPPYNPPAVGSRLFGALAAPRRLPRQHPRA